MSTLVLVDGSSYLYRAFHALPDLRTSKGEPTGALRGVVSMLRRIVLDGRPDYFAVVWDAPGKTFRDALYADYKATRTPMPDDLSAQVAPLHELVRAHGWPMLMIDGVEADDVIGTLARQAKSAGIDTLISTSDKDLAQLVEAGITCVNTMSNETLDHDGVVAKFGVRPDQMLDYLTLIGDSIDNVPGVAKVGPKTACKWLNQYGSLESIIAHASEIGGVVGDNLRAAVEWLPKGRQILAVKTDCSLPVAPAELAIGAADNDRLRELFDRFEFKAWLRELPAQDGVSIAGAASSAANARPADASGSTATAAAPVDLAQLEYRTIEDDASLADWQARIAQAPLVALDVQATNHDPMSAEVVGLAFAIEPGDAAYLPLAHRYPDAPAPVASAMERLRPWLEDPARPKLGHHLKFAEHALANQGIALRGVTDDTMLASYVLESHRQHDLDSLAMRHFDWKTVTRADVAGKGAAEIPFDQVSVADATRHSAQNADVALRLHQRFAPRIAADAGLSRIYREIEIPLREVLYRMERTGVLIDSALLREQGRELGERILSLEKEAFDLAGQPFNMGSPKQLCEILFQRMKLPVVKRTATGQPSTDEDVLTELAADYPLPKLVLEHRALCKLKSTYADKLPAMVNSRTGRVHTTFAQATAVTGRLASSEPNLQNIPVRTGEGRRIREAFVAPPGHVLLSADYSQVELRIMAHLSEDPALTRAFQQGTDIHRATAAEIFGVSADEVSADQRRYIKAVNFGLIYGMSAFGLAQQLDIERGAAQQFIDKYFQRYPGVAEYMRRTRDLARSQGYVETVFGRRLWLPDIKAASGPRRAGAERAAINAPMQGTAADLIKLAMIEVQRWIDDAALATRLVLQVHDELVFEVPQAELARIERELPERMTGVATLRVPLVVDIGHGENWEQAH